LEGAPAKSKDNDSLECFFFVKGEGSLGKGKGNFPDTLYGNLECFRDDHENFKLLSVIGMSVIRTEYFFVMMFFL